MAVATRPNSLHFSRLTFTMAGVFLCYGAVAFAFGPCLTSMADTFRVPVGRLGLIFTAYAVGLTPSVLVNGYLSEVRGRRPVFLGILATMGVGCALLGLISAVGGPGAYPLLFAAMVLLGFAAGGMEALTNIIITDDNQPAPAFALNIAHAAFATGAVLSPLAISAILRVGLPWYYVFYGGAVLFAITFVVLLPQCMPPPSSEPFPVRDALQMLRVPLVWVLFLMISLYVGAEFGVSVWVSPLLEKVLHTPRALAGLSVSVFWTLMIVGRLISGPVAVRFRPPPVLLVLAAGSALSSLAIACAPSATTCLIATGAAGLFMSGIFAMVLVDASRHFPQRLGAVFGIIMTGVGIGSLTIPGTMGWAADTVGFRAAMLIPAVLLAIVAGAYAVRWRQ